MARDVTIRVEDLGKCYRLPGSSGPRAYRTLREELGRIPLKLIHRFREQRRSVESFWALRDVSFEVRRGEILGVVGRNGAGKSTLLKIIGRIVEPSTGTVDLYGRVGSLLEVGTGFHPELTGRENIYLSGALLGMRRHEIRARFDEIVAFAEVEKFLDMPCKHYSSGMYTRLGFAVAAHLDADILLVDEVLAVGDAEFQRKCLGKMGQVVRNGRTVVFVSHNMAAVQQLCGTGVLLQGGAIATSGDIGAVVDAYRKTNGKERIEDSIAEQIAKLPPDVACELTKIQIEQNGVLVERARDGEPLLIRVCYQVRQAVRGLRIYFDLMDDNGTVLIRSFHDESLDEAALVMPGSYVAEAVLNPPLLAPRTYELRVRGAIYNVRTCQRDGVGVQLHVESTSLLNRAYPGQPVRSLIRANVQWSNRKCC